MTHVLVVPTIPLHSPQLNYESSKSTTLGSLDAYPRAQKNKKGGEVGPKMGAKAPGIFEFGSVVVVALPSP